MNYHVVATTTLGALYRKGLCPVNAAADTTLHRIREGTEADPGRLGGFVSADAVLQNSWVHDGAVVVNCRVVDSQVVEGVYAETLIAESSVACSSMQKSSVIKVHLTGDGTFRRLVATESRMHAELNAGTYSRVRVHDSRVSLNHVIHHSLPSGIDYVDPDDYISILGFGTYGRKIEAYRTLGGMMVRTGTFKDTLEQFGVMVHSKVCTRETAPGYYADDVATTDALRAAVELIKTRAVRPYSATCSCGWPMSRHSVRCPLGAECPTTGRGKSPQGECK